MNPYEQVYQAMAQQGIKAYLQEPLCRWTTFQIGGPAALFCVPNSTEQLTQAAALCHHSESGGMVAVLMRYEHSGHIAG